MCPRELACRNKIFPANAFPKSPLHSLFGEVVGKNHPGNVRFMVTIRAKGKWAPSPFAKIGAEECADPGASAFWDRDNHGVASGQLARAAAEIPAPKTAPTTRIC